MKTFLLIDSNDIDKFVNEKALRYNGVDKIKSFATIQDGLDFLKVQVITKSFTCPRAKSLLVECHPLDDQIVRALLLPTFMFMQCGE